MTRDLRNAWWLVLLAAASGACGADEPAFKSGPLAVCLPGQSTGCTPSGKLETVDAGAKQPSVSSTPLPCDVQTLLTDRCGDCHGQKPAFGAPMSLLTWEDLHANAGKSPLVNSAGLEEYQAVLKRATDDLHPMPQQPYPRLSSDEIALLQSWANAGAPARSGGPSCESDALLKPDATGDAGAVGSGDPSLEPSGPPYWGVAQTGGPADCETYYEFRAHGATGEHDSTPYMARGTGQSEGNEYRCFYFKPPWGAEDVGLWFAPLLDNTAIIHHWLLYGTDMPTPASGTSAPCQAAEPGAYLLAGWAPGAPPSELPADIALQLPSAGLILELHYYNQTGHDQPDHSGVKVCTAQKGARQNTAGISFTGTEAICIQPDAYYTDANPWSSKDTWNPGTGAKTKGDCDPNDDAGDIHMFRLWPHMHKLGRHMKVTLHRAAANGGGDHVIYDGDFDFELQDTHKFKDDGGNEVDEIILKNGDTMTTECWYDNRGAPSNTQQVTFGERTQNEMCYGFVWAWPVSTLITNDVALKLDPINALGSTIQPSRRCLNPTGIFQSCNGFPADYPAFTP